jgi:hypothetical protein
MKKFRVIIPMGLGCYDEFVNAYNKNDAINQSITKIKNTHLFIVIYGGYAEEV